ncbi:recombinase A [bacterium endosymbiont of Pedicinus badii]|nr:recombinase A [bacterium endosymbiont of Pedicinus badii]
MHKLKNSNQFNQETEKILNSAILNIEKKFGKGSIIRLGEDFSMKVETISTGSLSLDIALGVGGLPFGRIVEIYGPESSGKTTLTLQVIASAQKMKKNCAFIDSEHALDAEYAKKIGVDTKNLLFSQPSNGEQALEICNSLIESRSVNVIVIDSVAALVPKSEIEGEIGEVHMASIARMMSQAMRKISGNLKNSNVLLIFINQIRMKIGNSIFGSSETTTGGNALKFYSSIRMDIRKIGVIKDNDTIIGNTIRVKIVKNKVSNPFRLAEFQILYGIGINTFQEILSLGVKYKIVKKSGSWYSYNNENIGNGEKNAYEYLKKNLTIKEKIENKIRKIIFQKTN